MFLVMHTIIFRIPNLNKMKFSHAFDMGNYLSLGVVISVADASAGQDVSTGLCCS